MDPELFARLLAQADATAQFNPPPRRQDSIGPVRYPQEPRYEDPIGGARSARRALGTIMDFIPGLDLIRPAVEGDPLGLGLAAIPFYAPLKRIDEAVEAVEPFTKRAVRRAALGVRDSGGREALVFMPPEDFLIRAAPFPSSGPSERKLLGLQHAEKIDEIPSLYLRNMSVGDKLRTAEEMGVLGGSEREMVQAIFDRQRSALPPQFDEAINHPGWPQAIYGHEGRHRALTLADRGQPLMPVRVHMENVPDGDLTRWLRTERSFYEEVPMDWSIVENVSTPGRLLEQAEVVEELLRIFPNDEALQREAAYIAAKIREVQTDLATLRRRAGPRAADAYASRIRSQVPRRPDADAVGFTEMLGGVEPLGSPDFRNWKVHQGHRIFSDLRDADSARRLAARANDTRLVDWMLETIDDLNRKKGGGS